MINFQIQCALIFFIIGGCLEQIQATVNCPNDSFPSSSGDKCYSVSKSNQDEFDLANTACQAFHPSGSLASVSNAFDNQNLISKLQDIFGITNQSVWLGGNDATVPGKWEWIDGTSMQYTNWAP
uniref:C-type lectin domain-containing protein n=1 Tax=Acrobeloides nanus TaxID=290746 RepID=A0A914DBJ2_9BILA